MTSLLAGKEMSAIEVRSVRVPQPRGKFTDPFQIEVSFECRRELPDDLDFRLVYVGSAESEKFDQTLESVSVGPVGLGLNAFVLNAPAPNPALIPAGDLLGVTVVLLIGTYLGQEFVRVGYYVNNEVPGASTTPIPAAAEDGFPLEEDAAAAAAVTPQPQPTTTTTTTPAVPPKIEEIERYILNDKPRMTLFPIDWERQTSAAATAATTEAAAEAPVPMAVQ